MNRKPTTVTALLAAALLLVAGTTVASGKHAGGHADAIIGEPGVIAEAARTVVVDMTDTMRFWPASITVMQGETIRFVVKNSGNIKHEFVLGTARELKEHSVVMKKFPEMEHADENMVTVAAGQIAEVVWKFTRSGKVDFACLQPGHYDAGMKGRVVVKRNATSAIKKVMPINELGHKH